MSARSVPARPGALRVLPALVVLLAIVLTGCGTSKKQDGGGKATASSASGQAGSATELLAGVKVSSAAEPKVTLPQTPFSVTTSAVRVLSSGDGPRVTKGQNVRVNYVLLNGRDGAQANSTFGKAPSVFLADPSTGLPGVAKGTIGQPVGSRVLVAVSPTDGFGPAGNSQIGVQPNDTLVLLLQIVGTHTPLAKAAGTAVPPKAGLPVVAGATKPTIKLPKTPAPTSLITEPLIEGTGPVVKAGQTLTAHYTGVLWKNGKVFDSSWTRGVPANFVIGAGQVIPAWDKTIVGKRIGSRLLIIAPPVDGYGKEGTPDGTISGTDTLVFVVDLLDAG